MGLAESLKGNTATDFEVRGGGHTSPGSSSCAEQTQNQAEGAGGGGREGLSRQACAHSLTWGKDCVLSVTAGTGGQGVQGPPAESRSPGLKSRAAPEQGQGGGHSCRARSCSGRRP